MAAALLTNSVLGALRCSFMRPLCSAAASAATAPAAAVPATDSSAKDVANVTLHGTVERLVTAGPKHCVFVVRTSVSLPGQDRVVTFRHNVKAFNEQADAANAVAKIGSRVQLQGILAYEKRFPNQPPGQENPYQGVIKVFNIQASS